MFVNVLPTNQRTAQMTNSVHPIRPDPTQRFRELMPRAQKGKFLTHFRSTLAISCRQPRVNTLEKEVAMAGKWRAGRDSTPDPQIRSLVLYPAELPAPWEKAGVLPEGSEPPHPRCICSAAVSPVKRPRAVAVKGRRQRDNLPRSSPIRRRPRRPLQTGWEIRSIFALDASF